ncbi:DUF2798 domain-containing protein [Bacillus sp. USDA818B3_A]|uniref:DUF2798 domain-containing protein n=1 Tax=Bacillus sp. USDA818B3_A TaxID=2698834 RepID=UPI00136AA7A8|nr:DUF2798 domain-containing protein [Bacillus sp. USDA818B3_A]
MPTTKKESIIFGTMMCFGMVVVMTVYNLYINGLFGKLALGEIIIEGIIGFIIALLLDLFIVGPAAKKVAFLLPFDKSKKVNVILSISFCMIVGMVLFMSLYGFTTAVLTNGFPSESILLSYLTIVWKNFIFAFPLQLLIMGPVVRFLFMSLVKGKKSMIAA